MDVRQYEARWNKVRWHTDGDGPNGAMYEFDRDQNVYLRQQWGSMAADGRRPDYRYWYSGSDTKGNPDLRRNV